MNPIFSIRLMLLLAGLFLITPAFASQPKEIKQTNITDTAFIISWITDVLGTGAVSYGVGTNSLNTLVTDNHVVSTHYIIVEGLSLSTTYYYDIISGGVTDDNQGQHYSILTGPSIGIPTGTDTVYGQVNKADGNVAQGSLVCLKICNTDGKGSTGTSSEWLTVVDPNGYWSFSLSNVRTQDLSRFFDYSPSGDQLSIFVQGGVDGTGKLIVDTANDFPCQNIRISTDTTTPGTVNLSVGTVGVNSVVLNWTSPGDDGNIGTVAGYQVRYAQTSIAENNWLQASIALGTPTPKQAGQPQQMTVQNLTPGTNYYFAMKSCDEVPNWSGISNTVGTKTPVQIKPILQFLGTNAPNMVVDGLRTEIGTTGMNIVYQVSYKDVNNNQPLPGYPKIGIYREGAIVGTYNTMLHASGNYSNGAVYTFSMQSPQPGTYTYQFDGGNNIDKDNSNAHLHVKNGPIILESLPDATTVTNTATLTTGSDLIYGHVYKQGGTQPASGAVVYVRIRDNDGSQTNGFSAIGSTTVDTGGTWYMELTNFRDVSLSQSFLYSPSSDYLHIWVNGAADGVASQILMTAEDTPVCDLKLCNDHIPPATITNLAAQTSTTNSITLNWSISGDDGNTGTASWYHIRYATALANVVDYGIQLPLLAGNAGSCTITGFAPETTYYFIIQASDDVWNTSAPSLVATGTTAKLTKHQPILSLANKPLTPEIANVYTRFTYNVKYTDADGDPPLSGEPRVVICQGDKVVKMGTMSFVAGAYTTGATYTYSTLLPEGTYSYRFEVTGATSSPTVNGPLVFDIPKHLKVTNVTDRGFTVSWRTTAKGTSSVSYGTTTTFGSVTEDNVERDVHYITVENLEPDTVYYFDVTGSGITNDNHGRHYFIKTGASISDFSPGSNLVVGHVYERKGVPAEGAVVYVTIKDVDGKDSLEECAPLSVLTDADGGWFVDMRCARGRDYLSKFEYSSVDTIRVEADGGERGQGNSGDVDVDKVDVFIAPDIILHTWLGAKANLLVNDMTYSYPNPAKPPVNIITFRYYLNTDADVTLSIYNLAGELVKTIKDRGVGYNDTNKLEWDISDVASDIYIWRLEAKTVELRDVVVKRLSVIK
ncbi:MAG: fibronectin type III domain-containing protein [Candidatus Desantisbacteria bacterium]